MAGFVPAGPRSATAVDGKSDFTDRQIHSSIVLQDGATGNGKLFTVPQGQPVTYMRGAATQATQQAWQTQHTKLTTSMEKAGELGNGIGDVAVRGISTHMEQAKVSALQVVSTYGATDYEVADICSKLHLTLNVAKKPMFESPAFTFPSMGGVAGGLAVTGVPAAAALSRASNATIGNPGLIRRLRSHIGIARNDGFDVTLEIAGNSALAFRITGDATHDGAASLYWVVMPVTVRGDVR